MSESKKDEKKLAEKMAKDVSRNIRDITTAVTMNIDYENKDTIVSAFAALYSVSAYFEYKLTKIGLTTDIIQKAKDNADKYVLDVIASDLGGFSIDKGNA